jgi:hypothetical protein
VSDVRDETCVCAEIAQKLLSYLRVHALHFPALIAHQVNVYMIVNGVIRRCTVTNMCVRDKPNLFKYFEIAIDRREIYSASRSLDVSQDLLRRAMTKIFDGL